jgi:hypothetical protein
LGGGDFLIADSLYVILSEQKYVGGNDIYELKDHDG